MIQLKEVQALAYILKDKATIAGGCFRSFREQVEPNDIDIFCKHKRHFEEVCSLVENFTELPRVETNHSVEFGKWTVIKCFMIEGRKLYGEPRELVSFFDMNINRLYMTPGGRILTIEEENFEDIMLAIDTKQMTVYVFTGHEKRTLTRLNKYVGYGYKLKETITKHLKYNLFDVCNNEIHVDSGYTGRGAYE